MFRQVRPNCVVKGLDGKVWQVRENTLKLNVAPAASPRTSPASTELAVDDAAYLQLLEDSIRLSTKMARTLAINSRPLEESGCKDGAGSLYVSSTAFPLMEGCLRADKANGHIAYKADTAIISSVESTATAEVRAFRRVFSRVCSCATHNAALRHADDG